jgi:AcrR family transcriptional regulator
MSMGPGSQLPMIDPDAGERADAARNRARILATAERLFSERGPDCVSIDAVADAAGVGKGTVFRRFGSRAALVLAVLSEREGRFQEDLIRGRPPLGPGAPPRARLIAFGDALIELLERHGPLLAAAEVDGGRLLSAPYGVYRLHVTLLLHEADPSCDAELLAEFLLGALSAQQFMYLRDQRGVPLERLKRAWSDLVNRALAPDPLSPDRPAGARVATGSVSAEPAVAVSAAPARPDAGSA